jgi:ketosteroid isomerase-like protein
MIRAFRLRTLFVAVGIALVPSPLCWAGGPQEIEDMQKKWAEAVERNDPNAIGQFLHADFTFVNPRGQLLHRAEHLDDFRQKRTVFTKVQLSDVKIRIFGDSAVVTSRPKITGFAITPGGKIIFDDQPARFTDTLIRGDGKWLSVARHMSLVSP